MRKLILLFALIILIGNLNAQEIGKDSKGKSIFTHYTKGDKRFSVSPTSVGYSSLLNPKLVNFVVKRSSQTDTTIKKYRGWNLKTSVTTSDDFNSAKLDKLRPGFEIQLGRQVSLDTTGDIDVKLPVGKRSVKTYGLTSIFRLDNIKLFDITKMQVRKAYPFTIGLQGNYNLIFRNTDTSSKYRMMLAFTSTILKTWNDATLLNYQNADKTSASGTVIALEEFEGRYGKLENDVIQFRTSIALPIYIGKYNPIPYLAFNSTSDNKPLYRFGLLNNILSTPLNQKNIKIPSSLGIGIESFYQDGKFNKAILFIKGEISI